MTIEEIEALWVKDSIIDKTRLGDESLKIPKLHSFYYNIYLREKLTLERMMDTKRDLADILEKFYQKTLTDEELDEYGLEYSEKKVLKPDIQKAIMNYKDMVSLNMKIIVQREKTDFVKSILEMIRNRSFQIKDAVSMVMFEHGN